MENETRKHILLVAKYLNMFAADLIERAILHDQSKLEEPEAPIFEKYTPLLRDITYGTDEYFKMLENLKPALVHHYANNSHHPEFYGSIEKMNLFDIVEMTCDWLAATKRHNDGNINRSIEVNKERFKMSDQLCDLLRNTAEKLQEKENELINKDEK